MGFAIENEALESSLQNCTVEPLSRNRDPNTTQNQHFYAMCGRPERAGDIISSQVVNTAERYVIVICEISDSSSFHKNKQKSPPVGGDKRNAAPLNLTRLQSF